MAKLGEVCIQITDGSHNPPSGVEQSEYLMLSSKISMMTLLHWIRHDFFHIVTTSQKISEQPLAKAIC